MQLISEETSALAATRSLSALPPFPSRPSRQPFSKTGSYSRPVAHLYYIVLIHSNVKQSEHTLDKNCTHNVCGIVSKRATDCILGTRLTRIAHTSSTESAAIMATIQASFVASPRLLSLSSVSTSSFSSSTRVNGSKVWARPQVRNLSIRAKSDTSTSQGRPAPPSSPSGASGTEVPLGANATVAPVPQAGVPKADRIAYVCSACGYIYDLDTPFEEQDETYACPVCTAPREDFNAQNMTLGEGAFDVTKGEDASST